MTLFSPLSLGDLDLSNRLVMAPLTRSRSGRDGVPGDLVVEYYRQRASLGLIVSEGVYPSFAGQAFVRQPGLVTGAQVEGWRRVADAVHAEGGRIVAQVMHSGSTSGAGNALRSVSRTPTAISASTPTPSPART